MLVGRGLCLGTYIGNDNNNSHIRYMFIVGTTEHGEDIYFTLACTQEACDMQESEVMKDPTIHGVLLTCVCGAVQCSVAHAPCNNRARGGRLYSVPLQTRNMQSYCAALVQQPQKSPFLLCHSHGTRGRCFGRKDGSQVTARQCRGGPQARMRIEAALSPVRSQIRTT